MIWQFASWRYRPRRASISLYSVRCARNIIVFSVPCSTARWGDDLCDPVSTDFPDLPEYVFVRSSRALLDMKAVIRTLEPVHGEGRRQFLHHLLHPLQLAHLVSRPVET